MLTFLRSIKLAVVLIALLVLLAIIGGTLVQHAPSATYFEILPKWTAELILFLGFDRVFSSPLFFMVSALFLINLGVCTFHRFRRELRKGRGNDKWRFGPDLLHLGLIVLFIGGVITAVFREEITVFLAEEESLGLPKDIELTLLDFRSLSYEDNRPKDWISTVKVERSGELLLPDRDIEVNHPLRIAGYTIYQSSFSTRTTAFFTDGESTVPIRGGETLSLPEGEGKLFFMALEEPKEQEAKEPKSLLFTGVFLLETGQERKVHRISEGDTIGNYILTRIEQVETTGLKIVRDQGYPVVLIGILVVALGLFLTFYGKIRKTIIKEE